MGRGERAAVTDPKGCKERGKKKKKQEPFEGLTGLIDNIDVAAIIQGLVVIIPRRA